MNPNDFQLTYTTSAIKLTKKSKNLFYVAGVNHTGSWGDYVAMVGTAKRTPETMAEYDQLVAADDPKARDLKAANGWVFGGHCNPHPDAPYGWTEAYRAAQLVHSPSIVIIDCDNDDNTFYDNLFRGKADVPFAAYVTSTRKDRPDRMRCRIHVPVGNIKSQLQSSLVLQIVATILDPDLTHIDMASMSVPQLMYKPTISSDQQLRAHKYEGDIIDGQALIDEWLEENGYESLDDVDPAHFPVSKKIGKSYDRSQAGKGVPPREKPGIVGAAARARDHRHHCRL